MEPVDTRLGEPYDEHPGCRDGEAPFRPPTTSSSSPSPDADGHREKERPERQSTYNSGLAKGLKLDAMGLADILIRPSLQKVCSIEISCTNAIEWVIGEL